MPAPQVQMLIDGEAVDAEVLSRVIRLEVRESDDDPTVAAIRLNLTQRPSGEFFPIDEEIFEPGSPLAIDLGAPGGLPQRLFTGLVTHVRPHFEEIEASCYVEVLGMDHAVVFDAEERSASYPDLTDGDAAQEIFDRYGITANIETTSEKHAEDHQLLVQRGTDWRFLKMLASRNDYACYFEFDSDSDELMGHFRKRALADEPQADLTILRDESNLKWIDVQWKLGGPVRHTGAAIDPIRKQIVRSEGEATDDALGADGLADTVEQGLRNLGAEFATHFLRSPRPTDVGINTEGTAASNRDAFMIEARGELDPRLYRGLLRARRTVLIKGIGRAFSGIDDVRTVRTAVDDGQVTQTFIAERNALGQSGQEEFGQSAEETPAQ